MYTECPNCQTYFKITPNQLKAAGGKVRCGSCNEVFSALDGLVDVVPEEKTPNTSAEPENKAASKIETDSPSNAKLEDSQKVASEALDESISENAENSIDPQSFVDVEIPGMSGIAQDEVESALATAVVESKGDESSLDLSGIEEPVDKKGINQDIDNALDGLFDSDTDLLGTGNSNSKPDSAATSELAELDDLDFGDSDKAELKVSTDLEGNLEGVSPQGSAVSKDEDDASSLSDFERELGQISEPNTKTDNLLDKKANSSSVEIEKELLDESSFDLGDSFLDSEVSQAKISEPESRASDSFILEELNESKKASSGKFAKFAWVSVVFILFFFLLGEFAYLKRQDLAMYPEVKPIIEELCKKLNEVYPCEIAPAKDVTKIELLERNVVSHPNAKNALLITSTIVNNAEFDQAFPDLVLTFSDINQKIIAKRKFSPKEYLSKDVDIESGMKKEVPVKLMLEIVDPGEDAVNFEFNFY